MSIIPTQISDHQVTNYIEQAAAGVLQEQSWWERRKNTLVAIAQAVLQLGNLAIFATGDVPVWVTVLVAVGISAAETVVHAATKGSVTPSVATRIVQQVSKTDVPAAVDVASQRILDTARMAANDIVTEVQERFIGIEVDPKRLAVEIVDHIRAEERGEHDRPVASGGGPTSFPGATGTPSAYPGGQ